MRTVFLTDSVIMTGAFHEEFDSIKEAAEYVGVSPDTIRKAFDRNNGKMISLIHYKNGLDRKFWLSFDRWDILDITDRYF